MLGTSLLATPHSLGSMNALTRQAWSGLAQLSLVLLSCLLLSAGSLRYWQAWAFVALFTGCAAAITWHLQRHDPDLLRRRLSAGPRAETEPRQKVIQSAAGLAFVGLFIAAGLEYRFGGASLPVALVPVGWLLVAVGFWIVFLTFRANTYTSATVGVVEGQPVVSWGPYAVVRHPMYAGALVMLLGTPLALGSSWSFGGFLALAGAIVWRMLEEEKALSRDLPGYDAYRSRVRHRLVPHVW